MAIDYWSHMHMYDWIELLCLLVIGCMGENVKNSSHNKTYRVKEIRKKKVHT